MLASKESRRLGVWMIADTFAVVQPPLVFLNAPIMTCAEGRNRNISV